MNNNELTALRTRLKQGEYDGKDIMQAWIAIDELIAERNIRAKHKAEKRLAKHQPCGCIVCTCPDNEENRCHGCGAHHCGKHPVGQFENPVYDTDKPEPSGVVAKKTVKMPIDTPNMGDFREVSISHELSKDELIDWVVKFIKDNQKTAFVKSLLYMPSGERLELKEGV